MPKRKDKRLIIRNAVIPDGRNIQEAGPIGSADTEAPPVGMRLEVSPGIKVKAGESINVTVGHIIENGETVAAGIMMVKQNSPAVSESSKGPEFQITREFTSKRKFIRPAPRAKKLKK